MPIPKGPWTVRPSDNGVFTLQDADGRHFANLRIVQADAEGVELAIARVPQMVELLEEGAVALDWQGAGYLAQRIRSVVNG
jgi:hypothetical protein